jgi:hypothetical protein
MRACGYTNKKKNACMWLHQQKEKCVHVATPTKRKMRACGMWWVCALVVACALVAWVCLKAEALRRVPTSPIHDLRTGDLVLFRRNLPNPLEQMFSVYTHVGMVVRTGDQRLMILETHAPGDTAHLGVREGGVHMYDLRHRIQTYRGQVFAARLRPDIEVDIETLAKRLPELMAIPFVSPKPQIARCVLGRRTPSDTGMFCSHFVGHLLILVRALPPGTQVHCLTPESLARMPVFMPPARLLA